MLPHSLKTSSSTLIHSSSRTFATKSMSSSTSNKKDSAGRRLGLKKFGGQEVLKGDIILRQRGFKWRPGNNVHVGKDHTLHASKEGVVVFKRDPSRLYYRLTVHVVPREMPNRIIRPPPPFLYHPELYPELAKKNIEDPYIPQNIKKDNNKEKKEKKVFGKVVGTSINGVNGTLTALSQNRGMYKMHVMEESISEGLKENARVKITITPSLI